MVARDGKDVDKQRLGSQLRRTKALAVCRIYCSLLFFGEHDLLPMSVVARP
jgi:hypothetical protein